MHRWRRNGRRRCCFYECGAANEVEARAQTTLTSDANLVAAGTAGSSECGACENQGCLAQINFREQVYYSGLCPQQALKQGTMFPELVRIYK
ncbi:MAG: spore coat associated protein CotJA [Clostridia bacterium]|nr:spore coat associated protein CotJA [Clostridia bacterium]